MCDVAIFSMSGLVKHVCYLLPCWKNSYYRGW